MRLIDWIAKAHFDEVWSQLNKTLNVADDQKTLYQERVDQWLATKDPEKNEDYVIGVGDFGEKGPFDVVALSTEDLSCYSIEPGDQIQWLGCEVLEESVDTYGEGPVLAHILYRLIEKA